ncbi:hypothetical protein ACHAW5_001233 [Stephanodiscus triporus]|uniref:Uncharacterized protein n=1 Tax=Stephanodiscus triporus TaxID=2934178 RepID=A0ABD3NEY7_9STRA
MSTVSGGGANDDDFRPRRSSTPDDDDNDHDARLYLHVGPCGDFWTGRSIFAAKHLQPGYVRSVELDVSLDVDALLDLLQEEDDDDDASWARAIYDEGALPPDLLRRLRALRKESDKNACNFSTRLAGRFYQNGSLERHTFRRSRLVEMQERKRRLEEELRAEERRVELMMERLKEAERVRDDTHDLIGKIERGLTSFQASFRRRQAMKSFRAMRRKSHARNAIAQFFQRRYRGCRDRARAESRREFLRRKRRDESAATIQANVRRVIQRRQFLDLLSEKERLSNQSAAAIQSMMRGRLTRRMYLAEMKMRRRSSDAMIIMDDGRQSSLRNQISVASNGDATDETDSFASTLTSLTNRTNATTESSPKNRVHRRTTDPPSWSSPVRVVSSDRRRATAIRSSKKVVGTRRRALTERRIANPLLPCRKLQEECTQPLLQTCNNSELNQSTIDLEGEQSEANLDSRERGQIDSVFPMDPEPLSQTLPPPLERVSTQMIVSDEAKIIVREVIRRVILRHGIVHSTFDDEFSEHEDDLKNE